VARPLTTANGAAPDASALTIELLGFVRMLRVAGVPVPLSATEQFLRATALIGLPHVYSAGRLTLTSRREHLVIFDQVFARYFGRRLEPERIEVKVERLIAGDGQDDSGGSAPPHVVGLNATKTSRLELLRTKDFAELTCDEQAEVSRLLRSLRVRPRRQQTRRFRPTHSHGVIDLRCTVRDTLRHGGELGRLQHRRYRDRHRPILLLVDISGSMMPYSRHALLFSHTLLHTRERCEVFTFGTGLTRMTSALTRKTPDHALAAAAATASDWDGGTRIGESIGAFVDRYGRLGIARGAIVVIYSDGLDIGDPQLLERQMATLARLAYRIVWANPLAGHPDYEPTARGMAAAWPHIDHFVSAHSVSSVEELAAIMTDL
jgi:uncharacterized protein with von Willebrand factor type A (vWA) domain